MAGAKRKVDNTTDSEKALFVARMSAHITPNRTYQNISALQRDIESRLDRAEREQTIAGGQAQGRDADAQRDPSHSNTIAPRLASAAEVSGGTVN
ncbi:hypothetical protein HBI81_253050 [Parastagonospora nodorum]|nr:hypothetical protein HBI81_253050 [Parastagonospora nodorum]